MTETDEEIARLSAKNIELNRRNSQILWLSKIENLKQEVMYLKNKIICVNQTKKALREQIAKNEFKLKAFKNSSNLVKIYHKNNQKNQAGVGFDMRLPNKRKIKLIVVRKRL